MSDKLVIDHSRLVAIAPYRMSRSCGCVLDDCDLKAVLDKITQMGFDAHIRQHPTKDDLADPAFAQLQNQIIGLRPPYFVRADDDRLSIFDVGLEALQPVGARVGETRQIQRSAPCKTVSSELVGLERPVKFPTSVGRIKVMR